jgi:hypothetical protein
MRPFCEPVELWGIASVFRKASPVWFSHRFAPVSFPYLFLRDGSSKGIKKAQPVMNGEKR